MRKMYKNYCIYPYFFCHIRAVHHLGIIKLLFIHELTH